MNYQTLQCPDFQYTNKMLQIISFVLGSLFSLANYKTSKLAYKIYPYLIKKSYLQLYNHNYHKIAIITGATDGLGKCYAEKLFKNKFDLVLIGRNQVKLEKVKQQLQNINPQNQQKNTIKTLIYDFSKDQLSCKKDLLQKIKTSVQQNLNLQNNTNIHICFINSCAQSHVSQYQQTSVQQITRINSINLNSFHMIAKSLFNLKRLLSQKSNLSYNISFINISSAVSQIPNKYSSIYSATKSYCSNIMQVLNLENQQKQDPSSSLLARSDNKNKIFLLNLTPLYIKTKMIRYFKSWDVAQPQQIVEGSFNLLGRNRVQGAGCIKHEILKEFPYLMKSQFSQRIQKALAMRKKMIQIQNRRKFKNNKNTFKDKQQKSS